MAHRAALTAAARDPPSVTCSFRRDRPTPRGSSRVVLARAPRGPMPRARAPAPTHNPTAAAPAGRAGAAWARLPRASPAMQATGGGAREPPDQHECEAGEHLLAAPVGIAAAQQAGKEEPRQHGTRPRAAADHQAHARHGERRHVGVREGRVVAEVEQRPSPSLVTLAGRGSPLRRALARPPRRPGAPAAAGRRRWCPATSRPRVVGPRAPTTPPWSRRRWRCRSKRAARGRSAKARRQTGRAW
jgi:hypothetical protein